MAILKDVPASAVGLCPRGADELTHLLNSDGSQDGAHLEDLRSENARQRETAKTGSRIAATIGPLGEDESGVTLLFADGRANFGILTMVRSKELGPFSSAEIAMLTLALDAASERLSALLLNATAMVRSTAEHHGDVTNELLNPEGEEYVLDRDLHIDVDVARSATAALTGLRTPHDRLPAVLRYRA